MSAHFIDRSSTETIYSQISRSLESEVKSLCRPGDYLPSELELASRLSVHRHTIRRAIDELINAGLVERRHGKGTIGEAKKMCGAELLAVDVKKGKSVYYSGIFARKGSGLDNINDLKGRSLAVGSTHSTSSFNFPLAMIINAGVDPVKDLGKVVIADSHTNSIAALKEGRVDAAAASFSSWEKAVKKGVIDPQNFKVLAKSEPIPNQPLAINPKLKPEIKEKFRNAFKNIHNHVSAGKIRGYGGKKVDRYDANYPEKKMLAVLSKLSKGTDEVKANLVGKAGQS